MGILEDFKQSVAADEKAFRAETFQVVDEMLKFNARTPDQLKALNTSELVIRISMLFTETVVYQQQVEEENAAPNDDPELHATLVRAINGVTKDLEMSSHELDLRVPSRAEFGDGG